MLLGTQLRIDGSDVESCMQFQLHCMVYNLICPAAWTLVVINKYIPYNLPCVFPLFCLSDLGGVLPFLSAQRCCEYVGVLLFLSAMNLSEKKSDVSSRSTEHQ